MVIFDDTVYILSYTSWKRLGEGYRPRMLDCGINGVFTTEERAKMYLVNGWPEAVYDAESDAYRLELGDDMYAVYRIRQERIVY